MDGPSTTSSQDHEHQILDHKIEDRVEVIVAAAPTTTTELTDTAVALIGLDVCNKLINELLALREEKSQYSQRISAISKQLDQTKDEKTILRCQISSTEELVDKLKNELAAAKKELELVDTLKEDLAATKEKMEELKKRVEAAEDEEFNQAKIAGDNLERAAKYKREIKKHQKKCPLSKSSKTAAEATKAYTSTSFKPISKNISFFPASPTRVNNFKF